MSQISNTAFDTLIEYIKKNKKIDEELKRFLNDFRKDNCYSLIKAYFAIDTLKKDYDYTFTTLGLRMIFFSSFTKPENVLLNEAVASLETDNYKEAKIYYKNLLNMFQLYGLTSQKDLIKKYEERLELKHTENLDIFKSFAHQALDTGDIVLISNYPEEKLNSILNMNTIGGVFCIKIHTLEGTKLMLKTRSNEKYSKSKFSSMIKKADNYFKIGDYGSSLSCYKKLLQISHSYYVYLMLGNIYFKLKDFKKSLDYYLVAKAINPDALSNDMMNKCRFQNYDEIKPEFYMQENDFYDNASLDLYNISDAQLEYLSSDDCESLMNGFANLNLGNEQKCIVLLAVAKEYYRLKQFDDGDRIVNYVKNVTDKSKTVLKLLKDVLQRRMFYCNSLEKNEFISEIVGKRVLIS